MRVFLAVAHFTKKNKFTTSGFRIKLKLQVSTPSKPPLLGLTESE